MRLEYLGTQRRVELAVERLFIPLHHYVDAHYSGQGGAGRGYGKRKTALHYCIGVLEYVALLLLPIVPNSRTVMLIIITNLSAFGG